MRILLNKSCTLYIELAAMFLPVFVASDAQIVGGQG